MTRRVLILHAGGTISMVPSARGYVPMQEFGKALQQDFSKNYSTALPDFDLVELEPLIDSANLLPEDWQQLGQQLIQHWQDYDGFVVLHGTDTLAYTASALSFMLRGINKPVVLTGAQIPLLQPRTDASNNLTNALLLAASGVINEVVVCFSNRILRGNRSSKIHSEAMDAFDSPNHPWLGEIGIQIELNPSLLLAPGQPNFLAPAFDRDAVALVKLFPGISARQLQAMLDHPTLRGVVLETYGAGNVPAADVALLRTLETARERGISLLNVSQCHQGSVSQGAYATGAILNQIGVLPGADLTSEAAFAKLHFLLASGLSGEPLHQTLITSQCGEMNGNSASIIVS